MNNKIYIIANWKMQLSRADAVNLTKKIAAWSEENFSDAIKVIVCPSFTALQAVADVIKSGTISLGAQDVFYHINGAYTGEISVSQLQELGVEHVIVGHSERRLFQKESDDDVNRKIKILLEFNLTPIVCIGETMDERRIGKTDVSIIRQLVRGFEDIKLSPSKRIIIAYEPVWAISPAPPAEPRDAFHASQVIKRILLEFFSPELVANNITVIYGGSVDAGNIVDFIDNNFIQGVLVGGASLKHESLVNLIKKIK